jgi:predicted AAA+ superfamily ATPase
VLTRATHVTEVLALLGEFPVVTILGARQVGKTTLAHAVAEAYGVSHRFDLEDPRDLQRLSDPMLALEPLDGLVVLDEVQRVPALFPALRVLADHRRKKARFLLLGSAAPGLTRGASESLAGRVAQHPMRGFDLSEVGMSARDELWSRGGFPPSFLAAADGSSLRWRRNFIRTHLERDLPALGIRIPSATIGRFWTMVAHYHGQVWNAAELARAFGTSEKTVRGYLDILVGTFMVRRLPPWYENVGKREVKAPKVYLTDSGLLHALLGIRGFDELLGHPKIGASWEGFAIEEVVRHLGADPEECFHWGLHSGAELDLLIVRGRRRYGFEMKRTDTPRLTPSMRSACEVLRLDRLDVIHAGANTFPLAEGVRAVSLARLFEDVEAL